MPLYDYKLKGNGRVVTLYRKVADMDKPITNTELEENGYRVKPGRRVRQATRCTRPRSLALTQFRTDPDSQANQVLAGYRAAEDGHKFKSRFTPDQIKQAWSEAPPPDPGDSAEPAEANPVEMIST